MALCAKPAVVAYPSGPRPGARATYARREPDKTVLHQVVSAHLEAFLRWTRDNYNKPLPQYVERELRSFLSCGLLREPSYESNEPESINEALDGCRAVGHGRGRFERIDARGCSQQELFPELDVRGSRRGASTFCAVAISRRTGGGQRVALADCAPKRTCRRLLARLPDQAQARGAPWSNNNTARKPMGDPSLISTPAPGQAAAPAQTALFGGDSRYHPGFAQIGVQYKPFDLTVLEIGTWHPNWGTIHLGPRNALKAQHDLGGRYLLPIHWGVFNLALNHVGTLGSPTSHRAGIDPMRAPINQVLRESSCGTQVCGKQPKTRS